MRYYTACKCCLIWIKIVFNGNSGIKYLRAIDSKYGEDNDRSENSDFFYCVKKTLLVNYFQKYTLKVPTSSHILKSRKVRNTAQSTKMADGIYSKLYVFNRPVQKEGNLPRFFIHAVCNLSFYHSSELKVILKQVRFVYFSAV